MGAFLNTIGMCILFKRQFIAQAIVVTVFDQDHIKDKVLRYMLHKYKLLKLSRTEDVGDTKMPTPGENYTLELCVVKRGLSADCDFCGDHDSSNSSRDVVLQLPISQLLRYKCQEASCKEILCSATTVKYHQKLIFSFLFYNGNINFI